LRTFKGHEEEEEEVSAQETADSNGQDHVPLHGDRVGGRGMTMGADDRRSRDFLIFESLFHQQPNILYGDNRNSREYDDSNPFYQIFQ